MPKRQPRTDEELNRSTHVSKRKRTICFPSKKRRLFDKIDDDVLNYMDDGLALFSDWIDTDDAKDTDDDKDTDDANVVSDESKPCEAKWQNPTNREDETWYTFFRICTFRE